MINPVKTKVLVDSRPRMLPSGFPNLFLNDTVVERVTEFRVTGVIFDTKLTFESHFMMIDASVSSKLGVIRKALCLFGDPVLGMLLCLEVLSHVSSSSHSLHLIFVSLNDETYRCSVLVDDLVFGHRVGALCMFYKIHGNIDHVLQVALPRVCVLARLSNQIISVYFRYYFPMLHVSNSC